MLDPAIFKGNTQLMRFCQSLQNRQSTVMEGLWQSPKAYLLSLAQRLSKKSILVLTGASQSSVRQDTLVFSDVPVFELPASDALPGEHIAPSPDIVGKRLQVLHDLSASQQAIVFCSLASALQKVPRRSSLQRTSFRLQRGDKISLEDLGRRLSSMGYVLRPVAGDKAEMALRGGIVDVFPISCPSPYRIEIFDNQIESIRIYDPLGQRSVAKVEATDLITPAKEEVFSQQAPDCILDYLQDPIIAFDDLLLLEDSYVKLLQLVRQAGTKMLSLPLFFQKAASAVKIFFPNQPLASLGDIHVARPLHVNAYSEDAPPLKIEFEFFNTPFSSYRISNPFQDLSQFLLDGKGHKEELLLGLKDQQKLHLHLFYTSEAEKAHLQHLLQKDDISLPNNTTWHQESLSSGFALPSPYVALLSINDITGRQVIQRNAWRSSYHTDTPESPQLEAGDYVVHIQHGVAKYLGAEIKPNHLGIPTEFLLLEFEGSSRLFVPVSQSYLLTKYLGASDAAPKLHELGGSRWKSARAKAETAIVGYAKKLLQLYATRKHKSGFAYPTDSLSVMQFEQEFPYVTTQDQLKAVAEIKNDMVSDKAMDRLLCGDVGYGKTEVAMRAAFKAVVDGHKQVAVLVPTTVLAIQHFETFQMRMQSFPVNIALFTRFTKPREKSALLQKLKQGGIDILIGTHSILGKNVHFRDLGLIIVDEEQRFGVKAKEHLKTLKEGVDCLSMSATPIPRTLYMSLIGARDLSVIATPPHDRLPVKTIIVEDDNRVYEQALLQELARDGQAYIIHNRVDTLYDMQVRIAKLLPHARILVVHGQMQAEDIEGVFHAFKKGQADILLATTIVENGLDIPNANTILIDRADTYGLADLYQLRGRVGRWNRRAYAFFLLPKRRQLSEISKKRMDALAKVCGHGGGMRIALHDLEIRGAGDILGIEQSGHISSVGFHLYCKLLKRTIETLQGKRPAIYSATIEFPVDARLPSEYVPQTELRLSFYQRLGEAASEQEVEELFAELQDRFGPPPTSALWLYHLTRLRAFAAQNQIESMQWKGGYLHVKRAEKGQQSHFSFALGATKDPALLEKTIIQRLKERLIQEPIRK